MTPKFQRAVATGLMACTLTLAGATSKRADSAVALAAAGPGMVVLTSLVSVAGASLVVYGSGVLAFSIRAERPAGIVGAGISLAAGLVILPSHGAPEFAEAELGTAGLTEDEIELYNDLVPMLNARARSITQRLVDLGDDALTVEDRDYAEQLWEEVFEELEVSEAQRKIIATFLEIGTHHS
jgi:hypothetical protein